MVRRRVPLAWHNLTSDPRRMVIAAAGIGFAVLLMCAQVGFYFALLDSTVELLARCRADLFLRSTNRYSLVNREGFTRHRLYQAQSVDGVTSAEPLYLEPSIAMWRSTRDGIPRWIRVVAFDLDADVVDLPAVDAFRQELHKPRSALSDTRSKRVYGSLAPGVESELSGRNLRIVGQFTLGTDFMNDGNLLMSSRNFARYFPARSPRSATLEDVDLGLVRVKPDAELFAVQQRLRETLPRDVHVLTKAEMINEERNFWQRSTPVGVVFGLGTAMGFVVGVIICYQILFSQIADCMPEFATLRAMGYGFNYFVKVVLQQALILSVLGFVPGIAVSALLYVGIGEWTGLLMRLSVGRALLGLLLTITMCVVSGPLAVRKSRAADPAELFR